MWEVVPGFLLIPVMDISEGNFSPFRKQVWPWVVWVNAASPSLPPNHHNNVNLSITKAYPACLYYYLFIFLLKWMKASGTLYVCEESYYPSGWDKKHFQNQYPSFLPLALLGRGEIHGTVITASPTLPVNS